MADDVERSGEVITPLKIDNGRSVFAGWPMLIFFSGMLVFSFHACTHMVAAGDTWVAMACGRHHSNHGVNTVEPFSANSHSAGPTKKTIEEWPGWARKIAGKFDLETVKKWHPTGWVNQNWLTHTTFYQFAKRLGSGGEYNYDGLVYWKFIIFTFEAFCIYFFARLIGVSVPMSALSSAMALFIGRSFLDIRPACYANVLASMLLLVMALSIYKNYRYIWLIVPITVFWANVHGGYIYVFMMMTPFIGILFLSNLPKKYTIGTYCIGMWSFLYLLSHKFVTHDTYNIILTATRKQINDGGITSDVTFRFLVLLVTIIVVMMVMKNIKMTIFYAYSLGASIIFVIALLVRMTVSAPSNLTPHYLALVKKFIEGSNKSFYFYLCFLVFIGVIVSFRKDNIIRVKSRAIIHSIGAGFAAFIAMVIFNPFRLTNLTHTFEISVSKHAASWRSVNEWHPAFEMKNPVGSSWPFLFMFIFAWIVLIAWVIGRFLRPRIENYHRSQQGEIAGERNWPKIDIAIISVTALSVYMAVSMRRFIPIAAAAACPIMAMMLEQSVRMISSRINFNENGKLEMPSIPKNFYRGVIVLAAVITLSFGLFWGAKFKKIYLDPWPNDDIRDSVFMRMTASNVKPFDVCQFMRDNELSGNMFNYWTEGGALAFGQEPDPKTGRIPLQLFQDGRAQAAYSHEDFQRWRHLYGGGKLANDVRRSNKTLNSRDAKDRKKLLEIGDYLNKEMKKQDIWVFVLPTSQFRPDRNPQKVNYFPLALSIHPEWVLVYMDDHQQMYVNQTMKKGKELYNKVLKKQAKFPNDYSEYLTLSTVNLNIKPATVKHVIDGFNYAKKAFNISASGASMSQISRASGYGPVHKRAITFAEKYIQDFITNKKEMSEEGGYAIRLDAARVGLYFLTRTYSKSNPKKAKEYSEYSTQFTEERGDLAKAYKW